MLERDSPQSLSFCDLPISEIQEIVKDVAFERRSTTQDEEFEFFSTFNGFNVEICSPDDIFSHGKILPFKSPTPLKKNYPLNAKGRAMSHSCSVEYRTLDKDPSTTRVQTQITKRVSGSMSGRSGSRPKWYLLMFGSMRAPAEMGMSDIRSRQKRRSPVDMKPPGAGDGEERKRKWSLLKALSCRGRTKVGPPLELQAGRVRAG